jgi:ABC-type uncharacterized transport system substrate-binding protein
LLNVLSTVLGTGLSSIGDAGGLTSYGPETIDPYRQAAAYADRILKGEKAGDPSVQAPTKYELVVNRGLRSISASAAARLAGRRLARKA